MRGQTWRLVITGVFRLSTLFENAIFSAWKRNANPTCGVRQVDRTVPGRHRRLLQTGKQGFARFRGRADLHAAGDCLAEQGKKMSFPPRAGEKEKGITTTRLFPSCFGQKTQRKMDLKPKKSIFKL